MAGRKQQGGEITVLLFQNVLSMTCTGSVLFLLMLAASPVTKKKFSSRWHCRSYCTVLVFLLLPVGAFSVVLVEGMLTVLTKASATDFPAFLEEIPAPLRQIVAAPQMQADSLRGGMWAAIFSLLPLVWLVGAVVFLLWKSLQLARFQRLLSQTNRPVKDIMTLTAFERIKKEKHISDNVRLFFNPCITTPMLMGLIHTRLILPGIDFSNQELEMILCHELTHYRHRDLWIKSAAMLMCAIHWFNPCAYLFVNSLDRFLELSCDAEVVQNMDYEQRRMYGAAILSVLSRVSGRHAGLYTGLCENKRHMKRRLSTMLNEKRPTKKMGVLSALVLIAVFCTGITVSASTYTGEEATTPPLPPTASAATTEDDQPVPLPQDAQGEIGSFLWPTEDGMMYVGFKDYPGHTGMDIIVPMNTPVYASAAGTVVKALETDAGYGNYIVIDHGGGYQTLYAHNNSIQVAEGDTVEQGQVIAAVGRSGTTTGCNLHFEVRKDSEVMNPEEYVNAQNLPMDF